MRDRADLNVWTIGITSIAFLIALRGLGAGLFERDPGAVVYGDFNRDGFQDLAIGAPDAPVGDVAEAGVVHVVYGSESGLQSDYPGRQTWHQDSPGIVAEVAEEGDHFGSALAVGDFDGDGFDDLAVGAHDETGGLLDGVVHVIFGSLAGLHFDAGPVINGNVVFAGSFPGSGIFGFALAAGDFDGDGFDDLAVGDPSGIPFDGSGIPIGDPFFFENAGMVHVFMGSEDGFFKAEIPEVYGIPFAWDQGIGTIKGKAEKGDHFGAALAAGDFNGDGFDDLAVGVPGEDLKYFGSRHGAVNVIYGSELGLSTGVNSAAPTNQIWHQDRPGIKGSAEAGDQFGYALATGDFNGDGFDDLAVGLPGEDLVEIELLSITGSKDAGLVNVIYGRVSVGLQPDGDQVPDRFHFDDDDLYGKALATGDFDGDGFDDLAVGAPQEDIESISSAGAVYVFYGEGPEGLPKFFNVKVHQNNLGILGQIEKNDHFGFALAAGNAGDPNGALTFPTDDLAMAVNDGAFGAANVIYGSSADGLVPDEDQQWLCEESGIERFERAVEKWPKKELETKETK